MNLVDTLLYASRVLFVVLELRNKPVGQLSNPKTTLYKREKTKTKQKSIKEKEKLQLPSLLYSYFINHLLISPTCHFLFCGEI